MKVGILTFSCSYNFGAILQCYALQEHLRMMGHDVIVINYRPEYLDSKMPKFHIVRSIISPHTVKTLMQTTKSRMFYRLFCEFCEKYFSFTDICRTSDDIRQVSQLLDYIILGSDQIWNTKWNGNDLVWYGQGLKVHDGKVKMISYAASSGDAVIDSDQEMRLVGYLSDFEAVSVRESQLKDKLTPLLPNKNVDWVLDPSLMVDKSIWNKWLKPILNYKYILVYQARQDNNVYRIAQKLSHELNTKVITVDFYNNRFSFDSKLVAASPSEFVSLINNAECVVTTSFHGTAFSIITNTPFYTLRLNDGADGRNESLLKMLGLTDRFIDKNDTPDFSMVDFKTANHLLDNQRMQSQLFLKENLQ